MADVTTTALGWIIPAAVVFGVSAILFAAIIWGIKRARRSPRARAAAEKPRTAAGVSLVRLDDAIADLDIEIELSGAMYAGTAPATLRRARLSAQHARDALFDDFSRIDDQTLPDQVRRQSNRIHHLAEQALAQVGRARAEHDAWMRQNSAASDQVAKARRRLDETLADVGDADALVSELRERFAEPEWQEAARAADEVRTNLALCEQALGRAASAAPDPTQSALADLATAERALRDARVAARALEERHRLVIDASRAVSDELAALHTAIRQALELREDLEPVDAERLGGEVRAIDTAASELDANASRHPLATVAAVARLRDRLDLALGDARTAQQRLRGARTALPGTMAAARGAIAHAEVVTAGSGADARARLRLAQQELAASRQSTDPVDALDAARRALLHAEDASALAAYHRMSAG